MTEEQVKKGLEICPNEEYECPECPYFSKIHTEPCYEELVKDAIALINRLEEENKRLGLVIKSRDDIMTELNQNHIQKEEQIRKETAKEIMQELFDCVNEGAKDKNNHFAFVCIIIGTIIKLKAQEYGVEVEE